MAKTRRVPRVAQTPTLHNEPIYRNDLQSDGEEVELPNLSASDLEPSSYEPRTRVHAAMKATFKKMNNCSDARIHAKIRGVKVVCYYILMQHMTEDGHEEDAIAWAIFRHAEAGRLRAVNSLGERSYPVGISDQMRREHIQHRSILRASPELRDWCEGEEESSGHLSDREQARQASHASPVPSMLPDEFDFRGIVISGFSPKQMRMLWLLDKAGKAGVSITEALTNLGYENNAKGRKSLVELRARAQKRIDGNKSKPVVLAAVNSRLVMTCRN